VRNAPVSARLEGRSPSGFLIAALAAAWLGGMGAVSAQAACPPTPDRACKFSYQASFSWTDSSTDAKDRLAFKLTKGARTAPGDFGDPTTTDGFDLCVYADDEPVYQMAAGADGDCHDKSCWKASAKGRTFKDKTGTPNGITSMKLTAADTSDKTSIVVTGTGVNLPDLPVPLGARVVVQVRNAIGNCWGAIFEGPEQLVQDPVKHRIKGTVKATQIPTCTDARQNGFETALDCGGSCGACAFGQQCEVASDCEAGICTSGICSAKRVFVTSTSYAGNFGGLIAGDAICNARAGAAHLGGSWTAWLSDTTTAAIDRIVDQPYSKLDGFKVFAGKAQIAATSLPTWAIDRNEFNVDTVGVQAWTGTNNAGGSISSNCADWSTNASNERGWVGWPATPIGWSAYGQLQCNVPNRLLCFEN
jgi:hypothetical protein